MSTTPNMAMKAGPSSDDGMEFHSALTAAITAKGANSSDTSQVKAKPLAQDEKPQTPDSKKKNVASDSSVPDVDMPVVPVLKQLPMETTAQFGIALPQNNEASEQTADQVSSSLQLTNHVVGGPDSLSSLASFLPIVSQPTNGASIGGTDQKVFDGKLDIAAGSSQASLLPVGTGVQEPVSKSSNSNPDLTTAPDVKTATPVTPTPVAAAVVPAAQLSGPGTPKPADTSGSNAAASAVDVAATAMQQAVAGAVQSIAAPVSLPALSSVSEFQAAPAIPTNSFSDGNRVSDTLKGAASRQAGSAAKAKPSASEVRGKLTDGTDGETQPANTPTGTSSFAAKVPEAPGAVSQGAGEAKGALDAATLQQAAPSSSPAGSTHISQSTQSVSDSGEPKVPTPTPQEAQAMQGVSSAQLIQSMRSSEMKLGMQSAEFGNISISTSLNHQALSAQISFDHLELGKALAVHLPAIEEKLGSAYGVQAKVELRDSSSPSSSNDSGYSNSGQQSREQRQSQGGGTTASQSGAFERIATRASFTTVSPTASASRLDIRI